MSAKSLRLAAFLFALPLVQAGCATINPTPGDPGFEPVVPPAPAAAADNNGAIYQLGHDIRLFEDVKARRVGDILTILLEEKTDARKSAETNTARETEISLPSPTVFGRPVTHNGTPILATDVDYENSFDGTGASSQSNQLDGSVAVTVAQVLPNGSLVVQGEKWIAINQGEEFIRLRGIVREVDIQPDNTVRSTLVANAQIRYQGKGAVSASNRQGWFTRFFNSPVFPF
jgi:flagellar L-ring protein precursor FlgH